MQRQVLQDTRYRNLKPVFPYENMYPYRGAIAAMGDEFCWPRRGNNPFVLGAFSGGFILFPAYLSAVSAYFLCF